MVLAIAKISFYTDHTPDMGIPFSPRAVSLDNAIESKRSKRQVQMSMITVAIDR